MYVYMYTNYIIIYINYILQMIEDVDGIKME